MNNLRPLLAATGIALLTGACTTPRLVLPEPLPTATRTQQGAAALLGQNVAPPPRQALSVGETPAIPESGAASVSGVQGEPMPPLKGGAVNVNIEGMPVPAFINEFFGQILGAGFQMDVQVSKMNDLVTSVSYTHLDVYKRQVVCVGRHADTHRVEPAQNQRWRHRSGVRGGRQGALEPCLLYTSRCV